MTTTHVCLKTYYVRDRTGELRPITTKTYIVKNLKHDLLSGKMLNKAGYRIILDEDPEESGIFAVNEGKICKSKSSSFMGSLTNLYYIKTEPLCLREFGKISGYELWHRRLGHSTNRNIRETIAHSTGLEDLRSRTFDEHAKCPSCMIADMQLVVGLPLDLRWSLLQDVVRVLRFLKLVDDTAPAEWEAVLVEPCWVGRPQCLPFWDK